MIMTIPELRKTGLWSVHIEERCVFPPLVEENGQWYATYDPLAQLCFVVWVIPIEALTKTETPGGPAWDCKIALSEYKRYHFFAPTVNIANETRFSLNAYRNAARKELENTDLDKVAQDGVTRIPLFLFL